MRMGIRSLSLEWLRRARSSAAVRPATSSLPTTHHPLPTNSLPTALCATLLLTAALTTTTARATAALDQQAALAASQAAVGRQLDDQAFTDAYGRRIRLAELRGRPVVLSLVYTSCFYVCSGSMLHLSKVAAIARDALGEDSFALLTVGFDTEHDTPERMHRFARERGIDPARWHFVSADRATVRRLADELGFSFVATPVGFDHITQVTILDHEGRVAEQVYGAEFAPPALVEPLKQLVLRRSVERSAARGLLDRVRLLCTVYDPAAGRYRLDLSMIVGVLPAALVFAIAAIAIFALSRGTK